MPIRPAVSNGLPAWRWGKYGTPFTYGHGTARTSEDAARLAAYQGRRKATRDLVRWQVLRGDARTRGPYKGRVPLFSDRVEFLYQRMLRDRVRIIQKVFLEAAKPAINQFQQELDERRALMGLPTKSPKRRADSAALDIEQVLRAVREGLENTAPADEEGLRFVAQEIDEEVTTAADKQLSRLYNIPIASVVGSEAAVEQWIRTNVELITKMTQKQWDEIEALVSEAMSSGKPTLHLLEDIQGRFNVSYSRASLIARDQTAKLTGRINQERQTAHGITHFQWSTSGDARVRQSHADLDGQIFSWAEGAPGDSGQITPGIEYQCRCVAVPILPDDSVVEMIRESEALRERELEIMRVSPTVRGEIPNQSGFSDWNAARIAQLRKGMRSAVGLR